jgi:hypothetical protein
MENYQEVIKTTVGGMLVLFNLAQAIFSFLFLTLPLEVAAWLVRVATVAALVLLGATVGLLQGLLMAFTDTLHLDQSSPGMLLSATPSYEEEDQFIEVQVEVVDAQEEVMVVGKEMTAPPTPRFVAEPMLQGNQKDTPEHFLGTADVEKGIEKVQGPPIQAARVVAEPILQEEGRDEPVQPTVAINAEKDNKKAQGTPIQASVDQQQEEKEEETPVIYVKTMDAQQPTGGSTEERRVPVKVMAAPSTPQGKRKKDRGPIAGPIHKLTKEVKRAFTTPAAS